MAVMQVWTSFLTGLTTGGITCVAVQGGLLASVVANQKIQKSLLPKLSLEKSAPSVNNFFAQEWLPLVSFLSTKLLAHIGLGFLLGSLSSALPARSTISLVFQALSALFMLATIGNLLEIHPIFRYVVFQPPHFIQRLIRGQSKSGALFTPALLGGLTVLIPCGVTQAIEVTALNSGSGWNGAVIMGAFILGTMPLFAMIGALAHTVTGVWQHRFTLVTAGVLGIVAVSSLNGVAVVLNSPITLQTVGDQLELMVTPPSLYRQKIAQQQQHQSLPSLENGVQKVKISISDKGYTPNLIYVRQNTPVELDLETQNVYSCASEFVAKPFHITAQLGPTERKTVAFTPTELGEYPFSCSMGMFNGKIIVVKG